jgi:hypothetical protein
MNRLCIGVDIAYAKPIWVASVVASKDGHSLFKTANVPPKKDLYDTACAISDAIFWQYTRARDADVLVGTDHFTVAIERPFVKLNIQVAIKLSTLIGMVESLVRSLFGLRVDFLVVNASQWQSSMLTFKKGESRKSDNLKRLSKRLVRKKYGKRVKDDEADAINLAGFAFALGDGGETPSGSERSDADGSRSYRKRVQSLKEAGY